MMLCEQRAGFKHDWNLLEELERHGNSNFVSFFFYFELEFDCLLTIKGGGGRGKGGTEYMGNELN